MQKGSSSDDRREQRPPRPRETDNAEMPPPKHPRFDNFDDNAEVLPPKHPRFDNFDDYFEWFVVQIKPGLEKQVRRQIAECNRIGCLHCKVGFSFQGAIKCTALEHSMLWFEYNRLHQVDTRKA